MARQLQLTRIDTLGSPQTQLTLTIAFVSSFQEGNFPSFVFFPRLPYLFPCPSLLHCLFCVIQFAVFPPFLSLLISPASRFSDFLLLIRLFK